MSAMENDHDLVIVGAGAVGLMTALWSQNVGLNVLLIDKHDPGMGASFGNAGTIATYACTPVNSPSVFMRLPYLLFNKTSPLKIDLMHATFNFSWILKFLWNCFPNRVDQIATQLAKLLDHANDGLNPIFDEISIEDLIVNKGCLYIYRSDREFASAAEDIALRKKNRVVFDIINERETKNLEPAIKMPVHKALFFNQARHVADPGELMKRLYSLFMKRGGSWIKSEAQACIAKPNSVKIKLSNQTTIYSDKIVICAGAHSKSIAGSGSKRLPLDTERGYHLMFENSSKLLSRPVGWAAAGFYATPMTGGLRVAGTVELAGLSPKENKDRYTYLQSMAEVMLGPLGDPSSYWLGFRPTMPDALPVIGYSPSSSRIIYAFGHQHIGLTLSGVTGKLIASLLTNSKPVVDLEPYSAERFS